MLIKKCRIYLLVLSHFDLVIDHKLLVPILDDYTFRRSGEPEIATNRGKKISPFTSTATWRKRQHHAIPDALSRAPVKEPTPSYLEAENEIAHHNRSFVLAKVTEVSEHLRDPLLEEIRSASSRDEIYTLSHNIVASGFPTNRVKVPASL